MKTTKDTTSPLEELFLDELAGIYDAETRLAKALPQMAKAATHEDLQSAFESHLAETEGHVEKLKQIFAALGDSAKRKKCETVAGLLEEADEIASDHEGSPAINAALISVAQKVEHHEIAAYGCLHEWAKTLGNEEAADLLQEILEEEKTADETLTELAREHCNEQALGNSDPQPDSTAEEEGSEEDASRMDSSTAGAAQAQRA